MSSLKIVNYGDIQPKVRQRNLYNVFQKSLKQIEQHISFEKIDIVILTGDLFEYAIPNEPERKLIYNHLAHLLNIDTVKEIVFLLGNHDLEKDKKVLESNQGQNAINIFLDFITNLDEEQAQKIIYCQESKIYQSKISNEIQYIAYSLEDNLLPDLNLIDENKINLCLFHGMLKEYVDERKIPLRKDIYSSLHSIEIFPQNSYILASDIHEQWSKDGLNNQVFTYTGSVTQLNHNEGAFIKIGSEIDIKKYAEGKSIKLYEIENKKVSIKSLPIKNTILYITAELDIEIPGETIINCIRNIFETICIPSDHKEIPIYIKIKSSNSLLKLESEIFNIISGISKNIFLSFEYDKIIQTTYNNVNNKVITGILEENVKQTDSESTSDNLLFDLNQENIDSLTLSDVQLKKLFNSVLEQNLKSIEDVDITNKELSNDINSLFSEQLNQTLLKSSKRYNIILESIETNGFMKLLANRIQLNIPGLIRILGANGIGKTTLYNMIRWTITGDVFEGMSQKQVMRNQLIVFNKNLPENDLVFTRLNFIVNNLQIIATRSVERKWKNNTSYEQKISVNWKDYISTVDRNFKLQVIDIDSETKEKTEKQYTGEQAEKALLLWFGQTIQNIMFMNQIKLEQLLRKDSEDLNNLILNFLGIDYLGKLESNLKEVKTDLFSIAKPLRSKDDIQLALTDCKIFIKQDEEKLRIQEEEKIKLNIELQNIDKKKISINEELINIGNIPNLISEAELTENELKTFLDAFEPKVKKEKVLFTEIKPESKQKEIDSNNELILSEQEKINNYDFEIKNFQDVNTNLIQVTLKELVINETNQIIDSELKILDEIKQINSDILVFYNNIREYFDDKIQQFKNKKQEKEETIVLYNNHIINKNKIISDNLKEIESGVCDKCGTILNKNPEDFELHKKELLIKNDQLAEEVKGHESEISIQKGLISKIDAFIKQYGEYRDLAVSKNIEITNLSGGIKTDMQSNFDSILGATKEIELRNSKLNELKILKDTILLSDKIQYNDYSIEDRFNVNEFKIITVNQDFISNLLIIITKHKANLVEIKLIEDKKIWIQTQIDLLKEANTTFLTSYNTALSNYQTLLDANIKANNDIDIFNSEVDTWNNSQLIKQSEHDKLKLSIEKLKSEKLPLYNSSKEKSDSILLEYNSCNSNLEKINQEIININSSIQNNKSKKEKVDIEYENYLKYQKNNLIWKVYNKLISESFKEIVFEYYRIFLNNSLNSLLIDVNFKLFWNDKNELYHITYDKGLTIYAPIQQSSGMETSFLALALLYTIHQLNLKNSISHIFIDEISGTLSNGQNLSYESENYQELLVLILNKFKSKSIFIIDHHITNLFQTVTYEVRPDNEKIGSIYVQLT